MSTQMQYKGGRVMYNPTIDQLFEGSTEAACQKVLALFYQFRPGMHRLGKKVNNGLMKKLTLFNGYSEKKTDYGKPKSHPKHVAFVKVNSGLFHPHVLILLFEGFMRVWVGSSNILPIHFMENCQEYTFVQDFPRLNVAKVDVNSEFGLELSDFLGAIETIENEGLGVIESARGDPMAELHHFKESLKSYDMTTDARLLVGMRGTGDLLINQPRTALNELTSDFPDSHTLIISNSYLTEIKQRSKTATPAEKLAAFENFYSDFAGNVNCKHVKIIAANETQFLNMCGDFQIEDLRYLHMPCRYKVAAVKEGKEGEEDAFIHGKAGVCLDDSGTVLWALVGGFNFSAAAWGEHWPLTKNKTSQPKNFEVSVFLTKSLVRPDILRVSHTYANETPDNYGNNGLGWTLLQATGGVAAVDVAVGIAIVDAVSEDQKGSDVEPENSGPPAKKPRQEQNGR